MNHLHPILRERCAEVIRRWPTGETLLLTFNPGKQVDFVALGDRCYTGLAPTLSEMKLVYGSELAESWLEIQLYDLSEFTGCKDKMSHSQLADTAKTIMLHFGYLKITEMMVFFQFFKSGAYGHFYGSVDGLVLTEALRSFLRHRMDRLRSIYAKENREKEWERFCDREKNMKSGNLLNREEWNELRWLFNLGYER